MSTVVRDQLVTGLVTTKASEMHAAVVTPAERPDVANDRVALVAQLTSAATRSGSSSSVQPGERAVDVDD